ncbi:MAG: molecular chaperone HtpG [Bacteriovoracaceae bacterium]|nr:molecular chaperone HtpG [Bacteriovoracaceae bacterium]
MTERKGTISVQTSDIFPIIKKWLYSEHDIFLRELVANATDAISKRETLGRTQNQEIPTGKIDVIVNKEKQTIQIVDNGVGMTEEEVEKYIAQLAFSGAEEFVQKIKDMGDDATKDMIGKFGLGFYSSFMVAGKVEIDTLSMEKDSKSVKWTCEGDTDYTFSDSTRTEIGTTITLHTNKDGEEFLDSFKVSTILRNFCDFMPHTIQVLDENRIESEEKKLSEEKDDKKKEEIQSSLDHLKQNVINDTEPLWNQNPKDISDDEYHAFFRKLYPTEAPPLFWLHLKVDHPFTLNGILYFPKLNPHRPFNDSNIRLYCKQVFVSDNVKNIIPDFLSLLKGAIDSPDIPLNVSRSSLQGDPNIKRISNYVIKKVAEALKKLFNNDRPKYESIWEDIGIFIKYGTISDPKFDELMRERVIFKNSDGDYVTLSEYSDSVPESYQEKMKDKVIYFEKGSSDWSLRTQMLQEGLHAIETDDHIDPHFMQQVETKKQNDLEYKFASIDSEIGTILASEATSSDDVKIKELFQKVLVGISQKDEEKGKDEDSSKQGDDKAEAAPVTPPGLDNPLEVEVQKLKNTNAPAYFKVDEQMKRFRNMAKSMGQTDAFPIKKTLVINPNNILIKKALLFSEKGGQEELVDKLCHHVEDLATISSEGLKNENKEQFVNRSQNLIEELAKLALQ